MDSNKKKKKKKNVSNVSQLANLYQVSRPTMRKWIQPLLGQLGEITGRLFNSRQTRIIIGHLGDPE
ncbi:hypothetical protein WBG78_27325 [Chryseolinea sp. T2]|uniref:hypothetical protein n=1 Tax=Chryseolinea sp. T2 TaxID=3129255 RepID=UPI00307698C7